LIRLVRGLAHATPYSANTMPSYKPTTPSQNDSIQGHIDPSLEILNEHVSNQATGIIWKDIVGPACDAGPSPDSIHLVLETPSLIHRDMHLRDRFALRHVREELFREFWQQGPGDDVIGVAGPAIDIGAAGGNHLYE